MPIDPTPLGALLVKKRENVLSAAESEMLRSEVSGAARKLLLQYPETAKSNPPRSSAELTLAGRVRGDDSHPLKLLVLDESAELLPRLRISVWLALHLHDHGKPENLGEELSEAFAPLWKPTGPNWTPEALENAVVCLSESLLTELSIREEDEFKWWQPDYLGVAFRRILGISWQFSDVISALQYYPGELIMPSGRRISVNESIHTPPLPVDVLISTCEGIKEQIRKAISSFKHLADEVADIGDTKASDIFWYFYVSLRSPTAQRYLFSLPKNGIYSISLIKQLAIEFLHRYFSDESKSELNDNNLELKDSLRTVADEALTNLKFKYQDEPIVNSSNVIQRKYEEQLWWIESRHLPMIEFQAAPVASLEEDEFYEVLVSSSPIEPWERRLAQDSRNRRDTNHKLVKPKKVIDLFYRLLFRVRRKIKRKILRQALTNRYQASFESSHHAKRGYSGLETAVTLQHTLDNLSKNEGLEHFRELIRSRVDTLYIESFAKNEEYSSREFYKFFKQSENLKNNESKNEIYSLKGSVHPTIRSNDFENELKEMSIWLVNDIRGRVTSSEFEILCSYSLELLKQN